MPWTSCSLLSLQVAGVVHQKYEALEPKHKNVRIVTAAEKLVTSMQAMDQQVAEVGYLLKYKKNMKGEELTLALGMDLYTMMVSSR